MKTSAPPILPLFRSDGQARILGELYLHPDRTLSLAALARASGLHPASVQREVTRLEDAGLVASERIGTARVVRPNPDSPIFEELSRMVMKTLGPPAVLAHELVGVGGVDRAYVFGSWAARMAGELGPAPEDIDVLIVGDPDRRRLTAACRRAAERLGRDVQPVVVATTEWDAPRPGFIHSVKAGPRVEIPIGTDQRG